MKKLSLPSSNYFLVCSKVLIRGILRREKNTWNSYNLPAHIISLWPVFWYCICYSTLVSKVRNQCLIMQIMGVIICLYPTRLPKSIWRKAWSTVFSPEFNLLNKTWKKIRTVYIHMMMIIGQSAVKLSHNALE